MTQPQLAQQFTHVLTRLPQWIRHDLNVKDDLVRLRAEEAVAAMIAASLRPNGANAPSDIA
ncbi:hypothetical protein KFK14_19445 [Sphingobium phenoxybenzoativorans]|uniref:Uncharacterized protein n=1 Tax=Sphingobium phenoxybenzoativorans TaxID=1592790 RepID=A0A975K5H3_9SPHN|nr:hypothetical protein [Sphingobium phenoxybenzoativorans]QUT05151.1 hypothetical protein KFK14_19445 [Sphingobium phenoxybenzoativorans]